MADEVEVAKAFTRFCETIAMLRHPEKGCPWDLQQDFQSLQKYMLEEAYEAVTASNSGDMQDFCEELGDVLLQVVLNAQIARDKKLFSILNVIQAIDTKMRRRHPHVFDKAHGPTPDVKEVWKNWEILKKEEKKGKGETQSLFGDIKKSFPATQIATRIGKKARDIRFDWSEPKEVWDKLSSEICELDEALKAAKFSANDDVRDEIGDVYFTLAQLCRHLNVDAEAMAARGNDKFLARFARLEKKAQEMGLDIQTVPQTKLEELWNAVK